MKRHPALRSFSDDHHQGLVRALRLKRAASGEGKEPAEAAEDFLEFWRKDTSLHFRREEEVLLPALALGGMDLEREPFTTMLAQHARLRALAMKLGDEMEKGAVSRKTLGEIGHMLEAHIRLEERVVFPLIEETLSEEEMREISRRDENF
jgi:hemerythrin-like domain-containing protein